MGNKIKNNYKFIRKIIKDLITELCSNVSKYNNLAKIFKNFEKFFPNKNEMFIFLLNIYKLVGSSDIK